MRALLARTRTTTNAQTAPDPEPTLSHERAYNYTPRFGGGRTASSRPSLSLAGFGTQSRSSSLSLASFGAKILTVTLTGQNRRQTTRLTRWCGDITWTALHRVGEVRLAERRSPHSLHADWSRAAAWLLPELCLLPKDRPSNRKLSNMFLQGLRPPPTSVELGEGSEVKARAMRCRRRRCRWCKNKRKENLTIKITPQRRNI